MGFSSVAVGTANYALRNLFCESGHAGCMARQTSDIRYLHAANMVELQNDNVCLSTVNTGMVTQVLIDVIPSPLTIESITCYLRCWILTVAFTVISSLAITTVTVVT